MPIHTADADATKQFRRFDVGGVYWALYTQKKTHAHASLSMCIGYTTVDSAAAAGAAVVASDSVWLFDATYMTIYSELQIHVTQNYTENI